METLGGNEVNFIEPLAVSPLEDLGYCLTDLDFKEIQRNQFLDLIWPQEKFEELGLREIFFGEAQNEGAHLFLNRRVKESYFDFVAINNGEVIKIFVYPVTQRFKNEMDKFAKSGLTKRELEVVGLILSRMSNNKIVNELQISQNTLRTHLKSVYRKVGPLAEGHLKKLRK